MTDYPLITAEDLPVDVSLEPTDLMLLFGNGMAKQTSLSALIDHLRANLDLSEGAIYLGAHANDASATAYAGGAPTDGQLYWNSTSSEMKVWDNGVWQTFSGVANGSITNPKLAGESVTNPKIADASIDERTLAPELLAKLARVLHAADYTVGDGITDETPSFRKIEDQFTGRTVDLGGGSHFVDYLPLNNEYVNGSFSILDDALRGAYRGRIMPGAPRRSLFDPPRYRQITPEVSAALNDAVLIPLPHGTINEASAYHYPQMWDGKNGEALLVWATPTAIKCARTRDRGRTLVAGTTVTISSDPGSDVYGGSVSFYRLTAGVMLNEKIGIVAFRRRVIDGKELDINPLFFGSTDYAATWAAAIEIPVVNPSAWVNYLTYSEDPTNAAWTKTNVVVSADTASIEDPDGGNKANKITASGATDTSHDLTQAANRSATAPSSALFIVHAGSAPAWLQIMIQDPGATGNYVRAWFDISNGVVGSSGTAGNGQYISHSITVLGDGWFAIELTGVPNTLGGATSRVTLRMAKADGGSTFLAGANDHYYLYRSQISSSKRFPAIYTGAAIAAGSGGRIEPSGDGLIHRMPSAVDPLPNNDQGFIFYCVQAESNKVYAVYTSDNGSTFTSTIAMQGNAMNRYASVSVARLGHKDKWVMLLPNAAIRAEVNYGFMAISHSSNMRTWAQPRWTNQKQELPVSIVGRWGFLWVYSLARNALATSAFDKQTVVGMKIREDQLHLDETYEPAMLPGWAPVCDAPTTGQALRLVDMADVQLALVAGGAFGDKIGVVSNDGGWQ